MRWACVALLLLLARGGDAQPQPPNNGGYCYDPRCMNLQEALSLLGSSAGYLMNSLYYANGCTDCAVFAELQALPPVEDVCPLCCTYHVFQQLTDDCGGLNCLAPELVSYMYAPVFCGPCFAARQPHPTPRHPPGYGIADRQSTRRAVRAPP